MPKRSFSLPESLSGSCSEDIYRHWLYRTAKRQKKRDRKRGNRTATVQEYKLAIHEAVSHCQGRDFYTGLSLRWDLICQYDNEKSSLEGRIYKKSLGDLPTVDHCGDGLGPADFAICSWRVNDCKNDLTLDEFREVCRQVLAQSNDHNIKPLSQEHIEVTVGICGGKPRIAGHSIRVIDIVVCHKQQGMSPAEMVSSYPGLTLADIHAALAYYFDHQDEIQRDIEEERRFADEVRRSTPSLLQEKLECRRATLDDRSLDAEQREHSARRA